jgi:agmatine deiminase
VGQDLAASYVNFYLPNGGVIVPAFGVPEDDVAAQIMRDTFPDRKVVQVRSRSGCLSSCL